MKREPGNYTLGMRQTCPHCGLPPDFPDSPAKDWVGGAPERTLDGTRAPRAQCGECDGWFTATQVADQVKVVAV